MEPDRHPPQPSSYKPSPDTPKHPLLQNIPEARPGPNAFAIQAVRMDRHRLDGNAFYQQERMRRQATPPTAVHPALRKPQNLTALPSFPERDESRDSHVTTMSPFINAGKTPPLKLVPSPSVQQAAAQPTERAYIEERQEYLGHAASGNVEERTPVYIYTPKQSTTEFAAANATPRRLPTKGTIAAEALKSPKKFGLSYFRKSTRSNSSSVPETIKPVEKEARLPPKAQAVLGTKTTNIPRSPSKRKGFFGSRKGVDISELNTFKASLSRRKSSSLRSPAVTSTPPTPTTALSGSSQGKTPITAGSIKSDPSAYVFDGKRITSRALSEQSMLRSETPASKAGVSRTQSLKYMDHVPPPTPPAKNTPPDEKMDHISTTKVTRRPLPQNATTPSKTQSNQEGDSGILSMSGRISPTKTGTYAHKETPRLVTKPSMYSLHASVVPGMIDATTLSELKSRVDGLGLEGFSLRSETTYTPASPDADLVYSPSIYQDDWQTSRPTSVIRSPKHGANRYSVDNLPTVIEHPFDNMKIKGIHHQATESSSTSGTIPFVLNPIPLNSPAPYGNASEDGRGTRSSDPFTQSGQSLHVPDDTQRSGSPSSPFAVSIDEIMRQPSASTMSSYKCPSAMPSPLQILAPDVYVPSAAVKAMKREMSTTPTRSQNIVDSAPVLVASSSRRTSPVLPTETYTQSNEDEDETPKKRVQPTERIDQVLAMLMKLSDKEAQDDQAALYWDILEANNRLDERLAAVERIQGESNVASWVASSVASGSLLKYDMEVASGRKNHTRVPTLFAHDYYRSDQQPSTPSVGGFDGGSDTFNTSTSGPQLNAEEMRAAGALYTAVDQSALPLSPSSNLSQGSATATSPVRGTASVTAETQTIAELQEANRKLTGMVTQIARQMEDMQRKMGGV